MYNQFNYKRRNSDTVRIGKVYLGGHEPVRVQSMANTDTDDTENSVAQCIRIVEAGGEIVRFTAQGTREAENLKNIREALFNQGFDVPLVADIHFNANAADVAAQYVEKVRVNPGNFIGLVRRDSPDYTEEEYQAEYEKIKVRFKQLLDICKAHGKAIRIGVNHGSLSERMMNRWGDTPRGMVESCLEFLQVCREEDFNDVVISMKASNTLSMVHAVRLLVSEMEKQDMHYPLHLGVTEAGDGEDGRIKSAVGIGALLHDGIGDTIRVSLSEEPEAEIPVARQLVDHIVQKNGHPKIIATASPEFTVFEYNRRKTNQILNIGGDQVPVVLMNRDGGFTTIPDYLLKENQVFSQTGAVYPVFAAEQTEQLMQDKAEMKFIRLSYPDLNEKVLDCLKKESNTIILLRSTHQNQVGEMRAFFHTLLNNQLLNPVILCRKYVVHDLASLQIQAAADLGVLFLDGFGDGIFLEKDEEKSLKSIGVEQLNAVAFGILQACRVRVTKTEYISCPSCGRTMFNLQTVIARVKASTSHLKGLKIAIMGCIVNGPGEMADADYGYVGAGRGKVSLYKKKEILERNINEDEAVDKLVELIKVNGDWQD
ncbi:MAG: (E)-4-hydroxy-3-methylbut-2-enyl-diphosphate synthase [Paludibacter sp.]|nr:(E)-4-hydroxy-3-methylbut-2-enyl-diphosphate synthase [Paludibacter sp.]MDD4427958.1 (E)-4-hydroxy-3-methylbut-2-enyl-diphosphate synthase [Paludibacter sp.]